MNMYKKNFLKFSSITFMLITMILLASLRIQAAEPKVNLGTTESFAILAGETITNTGDTTISGDAGGNVGLHPGSDFTGQASVTISGEVHIADAVAEEAKVDLIVAYDDAAGRTPTIIPTELGGQTLKPGVYSSESGFFEINGILTLDAEGDEEGVFIFQTESTLITFTDSKVELIGDAKFCRVFWQVGSSATLGVDSEFVGHVFALESITAETDAKIQGQLLARNGSVTLESNTIINGLCDDKSEEPDKPGDTETPEEPDKPGDTETPEEPEKPGDTEKPEEQEKPVESEDIKDNEKEEGKNEIPNTGIDANSTLYSIALMTSLSGLYITTRKKRK